MKLKKEVREVVKLAEAEGFTIDRHLGNGHLRLVHTSGAPITIPTSPSKYTWRKNAIADIRRVNRHAQPQETKAA